MKQSFIFYDSFLNALDELEPETEFEVYRAITHYALRGEEQNLTGIAKAIFHLIKPQIDANNKRYEDGKKGGRPKIKTCGSENEKPVVLKKEKIKKPNVNENENENVNDNDNDNGNENVNVNDNDLYISKNNNKKKSNIIIFKKPLIEEVKDYCLERKNGINADYFYDYYESKGWLVGNSKMKDWKAAIRTWEQNKDRFCTKNEKKEEEPFDYDNTPYRPF